MKLNKQEKDQLVLELAALSAEQRAPFMLANNLPRTLSHKPDVQSRVQAAVDSGIVSYESIIDFLDEVVPWGKQHVFLFKGPTSSIQNWKKPSWVQAHLSSNSPEFSAVYGNPIHVALPVELTPASVIHDTNPHRLRITTVRRREWWEYASQYNKNGKTPLGEVIEFRAFVHRVIRSFVAFEWDLVANVAMLQISQLPGRIRYENVKIEFANLVSNWLDFSSFTIIDLHKPILKLLDLERNGKGVTRAHGYDIQSLQGRSVSASSGEGSMSVFGEASLDSVFDVLSKKGTGNGGNFYWLPRASTPLTEEIRVALVGSKNRVNFTSASNEGVVRHVLKDIRRHS